MTHLSNVEVVLGYPQTPGQLGPDPLLVSLVSHWQLAGPTVRWLRLDPNQPDDLLTEKFATVERTPGTSFLAIGGFSLGARIAVGAHGAVRADALVCFGYPFHRRGQPTQRHGLKALEAVHIPTLIVQGTRDAHGNHQTVSGYQSIPACTQLHWIPDGNHRYVPRLSSKHSSDDNVRNAAAVTLDFLHRCLISTTDGPTP